MTDTRSDATAVLGRLQFFSWRELLKLGTCLVVALVTALLPEYAGLSDAGRWALFILVLAAELWISEVIPAFAVGLLVIGLEIAILGRPGGVFADDSKDWERFIEVWGSPLIWLFFGGFVLASAAEKTGLTVWIARNVLRRLGTGPRVQLLGWMVVTFVFSMFISNTATATVMIAMMMPLIRSSSPDDRFGTGLLLGVVVAANLGGMGTIIGSPPNAIAAESLRDIAPVNFADWMVVGLPPSLCLLGISWVYLAVRYPSASGRVDTSRLDVSGSKIPGVPLWRRFAVILVFVSTVGLWLTSALHGVPATVISFVPICVLTAVGVLDASDIRSIQWDVLLLIAGGLALGVAVTDTGLANWLMQQLPLNQLGVAGLALMLTFTTAILSNLMSNTAATNILVPIAIAASVGYEQQAVVSLALGASAAMCLPISTPPNAIAYGTGRLKARDLLQVGVFIGLLAPIALTAWCLLVLPL
ncbi:MAG: DASS family sodium-coupled anion symporter [Fuerstiella sp.]